jgi:hypothetical protein
MKFTKLNKTQRMLTELIINRFGGGVSKGYTFTESGDHPQMTVLKANWCEQAYQLSKKYPSVFEFHTKGWRCGWLLLLDDSTARELLKHQEGYL